MSFDPYVEIGVPRDATEKEIRKAYRERAREVHPDAGGSVDKFSKLGNALMILTDPKRRKLYDEKGVLDVEPDNARAAALSIIDSFMGDMISNYLNGKGGDPRNTDLLATFRMKMTAEIEQAKASTIQANRVLDFLKDLKSRFSSTDPGAPIERAIEMRIINLSGEIERLKETGENRQLAIKIIETYRFKWEYRAARGYRTASTTTSTT